MTSPPNNRPRVLCIGESMALVAPLSPSPLATADLLRLGVAGAESTVALYLVDLGIDAAWASRVGNDPLGARVINSIRDHGVDTSHVWVDPDAATGVYFKDPAGPTTSVYYYRHGSAASHMSIADLADIPFESIDLVHISGITAALSESCRALVEHVLSMSRTSKRQVSFDVNFRSALWTASTAAPQLAELSNQADLVLVGQDEAQTLWNTESPDAVRRVISQPDRLVVKDGARGATEFSGDTHTFVPAEKVDVVEVVGAGDAFAAGYVAASLQNLPATERLAQGHRLAARTLSSMSDYVPETRV